MVLDIVLLGLKKTVSNKYSQKFISWFHKTFIWWFSSLFGRLGILFSVAAFFLVFVTYYVINWAVTDKDNILDVHDAYYHYRFVQSWGDQPDTNQIKDELDNLKLLGAIFYLDADTLCHDNYLADYNQEKKLTYWSNVEIPFSFCDYVSYQDSKHLSEIHKVKIPEIVSFGDILIGNELYPASVIENSPWQVLLIVNSPYPKEWITFLPVVIISVLLMFLLYLIVSKFLQPIKLMQRRIKALEAGDLNSTINVSGKDELAMLSHNFNNLTKQVKDLLSQKDRLLSEVSHELGTPLAKIKLLIEMIKPQAEIQKNVAPMIQKLNSIDMHVDYLDSIIKNVLISDKLAMPYTNLEIATISINDLIGQALDLSKNKNTKYNDKNSFMVKCDTVKMSIVIRNLLDNARKYAPSKKPVEIIAQLDNNIAKISIRDFGPGISETLIQNITKPYVRGKNLKQPGFGLGLSICKKVMTSHGGSLTIKNMKDQGACFIIAWACNNLKEK
jgi:signal transduction histidine kinase